MKNPNKMYKVLNTVSLFSFVLEFQTTEGEVSSQGKAVIVFATKANPTVCFCKTQLSLHCAHPILLSPTDLHLCLSTTFLLQHYSASSWPRRTNNPWAGGRRPEQVRDWDHSVWTVGHSGNSPGSPVAIFNLSLISSRSCCVCVCVSALSL